MRLNKTFTKAVHRCKIHAARLLGQRVVLLFLSFVFNEKKKKFKMADEDFYPTGLSASVGKSFL